MGANVGHGSSGVRPFAGHSMSECCMCNVRLSVCNGCQLLQFSYPPLDNVKQTLGCTHS